MMLTKLNCGKAENSESSRFFRNPLNGSFIVKTLILMLCCSVGAATSAAPAPPSTEDNTDASKPNIVFIYADDWGWGDLSCHGHEWLKTPNIDRLASEGTDFQQFNVLNPVCSPSRTAVMTGKYPARFNIHQHFASAAANRNRNMPDWLDPNVTMLPRLLKQAGYRTAHLWQVASDQQLYRRRAATGCVWLRFFRCV